jgi:hypothetical protein
MGRTNRLVLPAALLGLGAMLALGACASLPLPRSGEDTLVVGYFNLDFPEGYLGGRARDINSEVLLHFRNDTRGTCFARFTHNGYFTFRAPGQEDYRLVSYEYSTNGPYYQSYLNDAVDIAFRTEPDEVLDLGRITIRYTDPRISNHVTFARVLVMDDWNGGDWFMEDWGFGYPFYPFYPFYLRQYVFWSYERAFQRTWDPAALEGFLRRAYPQGQWQSRAVQEAR